MGWRRWVPVCMAAIMAASGVIVSVGAVPATSAQAIRVSGERGPSFGACYVTVLSTNVGSASLWLVGGLLSCGVAALYGAMAIGVAAGRAVAVGRAVGATAAYLVAALVPHGLTEICGFCLTSSAAVLGVAAGISWLRASSSWKVTLRGALRCAVIGYLLLIFSAGIECAITPRLMRAVGVGTMVRHATTVLGER